MSISRRSLLAGSLAMGTALGFWKQVARAQTARPTITVYKSPT